MSDQSSMSDCAETARRVFAYIDGELTAGQVAEIEVHLDHCGHCSKVHQIERRLIEAIGARQAPPNVQALQARVLKALRAAQADG